MTVITFFDSTLELPLGFVLWLLYSFSPLLGVPGHVFLLG